MDSSTPHTDFWLARVVAGGLILVTLVGLGAATYLRAIGSEPGELGGIASTGIGALAGFLTGVALTTKGPGTEPRPRVD